jgi:hypothetical protein
MDRNTRVAYILQAKNPDYPKPIPYCNEWHDIGQSGGYDPVDYESSDEAMEDVEDALQEANKGRREWKRTGDYNMVRVLRRTITTENEVVVSPTYHLKTYTYWNNSKRNREKIMEVTAESISKADEIFLAHTGNIAWKTPHVSTSISTTASPTTP